MRVAERMARETRTSSRVNPFARESLRIVGDRPLEYLHRAVDRVQAEGPPGRFSFRPLVQEKDPGLRNLSAGKVPDLGDDIGRTVLAVDPDPGDRQGFPEFPPRPRVGFPLLHPEPVAPRDGVDPEADLLLLEDGRVERLLRPGGDLPEDRLAARGPERGETGGDQPEEEPQEEENDRELDH